MVTDGFCELFGYKDRSRAIYEMDHDMYADTHPHDTARIEEAAVRFAEETAPYDVIYRTKNKTASDYIIIHAFGQHVLDENGVRLAYVWYANEGVYSEKTAGRESDLNAILKNSLHEESILLKSRYDYLTGLPNMTYFFELAERERDSLIAAEKKPALLLMNMCGLRFYNHKYGFAAGDDLLRAFSKIISEEFGSSNCCHTGQDHFAAISDDSGLEERLNRVFDKFKKVSPDAPAVHIGVYSDSDGKTVPVSIAGDRAKLACDSLRGSTRSAFCYYKSELREKELKKQYILDNFEEALSERRIEIHYQPIIRSVNGRVCDEEALSRWNDPQSGLLPPAEFIPILEESRLVYKLDLYLLERVLEKITKQKEEGLTIVPHSINLSRSDFDSCDIVEEIRRRVDDAGVARSLITVEITESVIGSDPGYIKKQIERFRELGFPVWMDDFGSAYSSLDLLGSIKFDLVKFDMSFMKKLDEGESERIILSELMKMAAALDIDTVCEGVETERQARFLKEIGCSKMQGFLFCRPIPYESLKERYEKGLQIGYENPDERDYFRSVGRLNLYDLSVIVGKESASIGNAFDTLPMGIIEVRGNTARFARSNKSYRKFIKNYFGFDLSVEGAEFSEFDASFMVNVVETCCKRGVRSFYDESMPDGSVVHSFARRLGVNPVTGDVSVAVAVLSITDADSGSTYAEIARTLAADYYNIFYIDLKTEKFIEYSSPVGGEGLTVERRGENFFEECRQASDRVYEEDREYFYTVFNKENVIRELDEQGVFNATYRLVDMGDPVYVNMKITRMQQNSDHIIMGISIIDAQMKHNEATESLRRERDALSRIMALSEDYLSLYMIDPETGKYVEYSSTEEYESLNFAKEGDDFFLRGIEDGKKVVCRDDLPKYLERFTKENIMRDIKELGMFTMHYRLMIDGKPNPVSLRIAMIREDGREKLIAGVRVWKDRR